MVIKAIGQMDGGVLLQKDGDRDAAADDE